jgi:hypothetical protein
MTCRTCGSTSSEPPSWTDDARGRADVGVELADTLTWMIQYGVDERYFGEYSTVTGADTPR